MKKRSVSIISLITLFLINLISAQYYGYNRFSITGLFDSINPQTMILGGLFLIFFILIFYPLSRVFKDSYGQPNKTIAGVLAFVISTLMVYGINRYGFDIEGLFYGIGLSSDILYIILPIILLIGAIFLIRWLGFAAFFLITGLLLILLTLFTDIFYEKGLVLIIGFIMLLIGLVWWWMKRGRYTAAGRGAVTAGKYIGGKYDWEKEKRQAKWIGRGARKMVGREDPRIKLGRYERKRAEYEKKMLAKRRLEELKERERWEKEGAKRRLQEPEEEARRQKEAQRQQKLQQNEEAKRQREYKISREEALKEETRRQREQQNQIEGQEKERRKAEEQEYKEESRRQKKQQKSIERDQRKQQEAVEKAQREALEENQRREETKRNELERQGKKEEYKKMKEEMMKSKETEKAQLNERQRQREIARKRGLREINQQEKMIKRQLKDKDISKRSKKILEQRIIDLKNRRVVFKRYGVGKENI